MHIKLAIMFPFMLLTGCVSIQQQGTSLNETDLRELTNLIVYTFERSESSTDEKLTDTRILISNESLDGVWFYSQINTGRENKVYRQRLNHLNIADDGQSISLTAYKLTDPERFIDAWDHPEKLATLSKSDFTNYLDDGCQQTWTQSNNYQWKGYVDPDTCIIDSTRRKTKIRIESESILDLDSLKTSERGFKLDGTFLWGSKPGQFITLTSVK